MQTNFTPEQLADPAMQSSEKILRTCVHCGFCTATCPTYVLLGDELDSPRGRIYLIKDMLEGGKPATPQVVKHIDRCLSCLSCMTTCPPACTTCTWSTTRAPTSRRPTGGPGTTACVRALLARVLPYPDRFRARACWRRCSASRSRALVGRLPHVGNRLRAMLELAPARAAVALAL